ncbi:MAG TPA: hypothetical protein GX505_07910 [Clostridiales bacterium]|nr:hypothetical protein [Clostridiales bacterium]
MKRYLKLDSFHLENCEPFVLDKEIAVVKFNKGKGRLIAEGMPMTLGGTDWHGAKYLVFDVIGYEEQDIALLVEFWNKDNHTDTPTLNYVIGILPKIRTRIALPLEALNSEEMFLKRTPCKLKTVVHGDKVYLDEANRFAFSTRKSSFEQRLEISNVYLSDEEPNYPVPEAELVDQLGQYIKKDWPGKVHSEKELVCYLHHESEVQNKSCLSEFSNEWSRYGGWKNKRFDPTGYFRTEYDGDRWWLVDPDGYAFYSNGLDCVHPHEQYSRISGIENFLTWLPDKNGMFRDAWRIAGDIKEYYPGESDLFDFAISNLIRAFGEDWWDKWAKLTKSRLIEWGFNTVGNWSDAKFIRYANLPYVWPLRHFPQTKHNIFRDFPDVFSTEYRVNSAKFAQQLKDFEGDKNMIGYFLRNEPIWAFVDMIIAEKVLENEQMSDTKEALIEFISKKYDGDISKFNSAWNLSLNGFEQLRRSIRKASRLSPQALNDLEEFSRIMIDMYVKIPSEEVKKVDPYHLNLGMRYGHMTRDNLAAGCKYFDVFSINCYNMNPTNELMKAGTLTGMPVMIGEFHFGALDRGLMATGLRAVTTQTERGRAYKYYCENAAAVKYCVGTHYFTLGDQSFLGRPDGENYQIGVVNVCNKPYNEFVEGIIETHREIYEAAQGLKEKYNIHPEEIAFIAY